jgi:hypothetical protein
MLKFFCLSLLLFGAVFGSAARAESVLFLNPGTTQEAFWVSYSQFMQAAAHDLGIDLQILYSRRQPELTVAQARLPCRDRTARLSDVRQRAVRCTTDPASGGRQRGQAVHGQRVLTADQQALVGERADRIGSLVPNDEEGGYLMMKELIRLHPPVARDEPIEVLAFSGLKITPSAQLRERHAARLGRTSSGAPATTGVQRLDTAARLRTGAATGQPVSEGVTGVVGE